jgi:hypothetical protein
MTTTLEWHAVETALPDDDITLLIAEMDGDVSMGFMDGDQWRYDTAERVLSTVTHWAHIPAHPTQP